MELYVKNGYDDAGLQAHTAQTVDELTHEPGGVGDDGILVLHDFTALISRSVNIAKEIRGFKTAIATDWSKTAPKDNHRLPGYNKKEIWMKAHKKKAPLLVYTSELERFCMKQRVTAIEVEDTYLDSKHRPKGYGWSGSVNATWSPKLLISQEKYNFARVTVAVARNMINKEGIGEEAANKSNDDATAESNMLNAT